MKRIVFVLVVLSFAGSLFAQPLKPVNKKVNLGFLAPQDEEVLEAAKNNDFSKLQELLKAPLAMGAVNAADKQLRTPLMYAAKNKNLQMIQLLLQKGARVDQKDSKQNTALYYAFRGRDIEIFKTLLPKADLRDASNRRMLHEMVMGQSEDSSLPYIQAYFEEALARGKKDYPDEPGAIAMELLYGRFPGEKYDADEPAPVLMEEVALTNPKTKAFFKDLDKTYAFHWE